MNRPIILSPDTPIPAKSWIGLFCLTAAYTVSFIDRTAVSVVQGSIKSELQLTDWQIGLMIGPSFAIVYSLAGLPLARLAEKQNRSRLLVWCIAIWSAMTMACGFARDFMTMFLARMGVGIGEAGGNPASHSLIADFFPENRRATAIAIYTLGAPLGTFIGAAGVGWLASEFGWRTAFLVLGIPGFLLAGAMLLWLRDPIREDSAGQGPKLAAAPPPFREVWRELFQNSAFRHLVWGGSLVVLVGYSLAAFLPALLIRRYNLPLAEVGLITGTVAGIGGAIGTMAGGFAGDRWGRGRPKYLAVVTALAVFPAPLLLISGIMSQKLPFAVAGTLLGMIAIYGYIAPAFAQVHALAGARSRATVTSIYYLVTNLVGLGIGPPLLGAMSDYFSRQAVNLDSASFAETCLKVQTDASADCSAAMASGIETALLVMSLLPFIAGIHFLIAAKRYDDTKEKLQAS